MPFQSAIGGTLRREVLREMLLVAGEDRRSPFVRAAQQLVQRRLVCDRDPDERRVERQGDERGNGQRSASPIDLRDDHGHAGGPPPEERPLLGPEILHGGETSD